MCKRCEHDTCRKCGKEFPTEVGTGVTPGYPVCDLCPKIDDLEIQLEDLVTDFSGAPDIRRYAFWGSIMAVQLRLSELKLQRESRL